MAGILAGCTIPPALRPVASDEKPENVRILVAKAALTSLPFAAATVTNSKIINATISAPSQDINAFTGEEYTTYCVNASIENPLFPLHRPVSSEVDIVLIKGRRIAIPESRVDVHCRGTDFQPFPEIEQLSIERYKTR